MIIWMQLKFIKERNRMCAAHKGGCAWCPANGDNCSVILKGDLSADEQVKIVEAWAAAHPRKTRQDLFFGAVAGGDDRKRWHMLYLSRSII